MNSGLATEIHEQLTESEYGTDRLVSVLDRLHGRDPVDVVSESLRDLRRFSGAAARTDDLAIMALRRMA